MTLLTVEQLCSLDYIPNTEQVSLKLIAEFYDRYLSKKQMYYRIAHQQQEIRLRFETGALCHLLGIHHIVSGREGRSHLGHENLKNEKITFKTLEARNPNTYQEQQLRMLGFHFIYQLIQNPNLQEGDKKGILRADFIFYDNITVKRAQLFLRKQFEKDSNSNFYVPVSYSIDRRLPNKRKIGVKEIKEVPFNEGQ